jgi:hypothetical protein
VHGFDYTALHWADKQKPLREVAGEFSVFPESVKSPSLVPEAIDEAAPLPAPEIAGVAAATTLVEPIKVSVRAPPNLNAISIRQVGAAINEPSYGLAAIVRPSHPPRR